MEAMNLILFFSSIALLGAIRFFEGWKSFFKAFGIWMISLALTGIGFEIFGINREDSFFKIGGLIVLVLLNSGFGFYLFKKGYLGIIFK